MDVRHYCLYADPHLALAEDQMIAAVTRTLNWDPKISYDYYAGKSIGAVRRALDDESFRAEFMKSLRDRLPKPEHRKFVHGVAEKIMQADGVKKPEEFAALSELKKALGT